YKDDVLKMGPIPNRTSWGGEDLTILRKLARLNTYKVIRSLDPGLFHLYHPKSCQNALDTHTCLRTRANSEASKTSLGLWYFKHKDNNPPSHNPDYENTFSYEAEARTKEQVETQWLFVSLVALALVTLVFCDMALMVRSFRIEKRKISRKTSE
ncbi:hypothetical protein OTU49_007952, partial [Cherax quadricarinatus]